jgi:hypothetical protein
MSTNTRILTIVLTLQGLILLGQWTSGAFYQTPAAAAFGDTGDRIVELVDQQKQTNQKLDKLIGILEGGNLQVHVAKPDEKK